MPKFIDGQLFDDDGTPLTHEDIEARFPRKILERYDPISEMNKTLEKLEQERIDSLHKAEFVEELRKLPDFILASYLSGCLDSWNETVALRENAFGMPLNQHGASTAE